MSNTNNTKKQLQWEVSFKRNGDFPLDRSSIFKTYDEADDYVNGRDGNKKGVPYLGQVFTILSDSENTQFNDSGVYVIKELPNEGNEYKGRFERAGEVVGGQAVSVVDGNHVDIKLSDSEKNYLIKNDSGLAVTGIEANKTTTSEEIKILGGPLAEEANSVFNGGVIPSGTSIEYILSKLLCKETYTKPGKSAGSCSFTVDKPNLSSSNTTKSTLVEVGTVVTFNEIVARPVTVKTSNFSNPYVGIFTNGYRTELTGQTIVPSDGYVRASWNTGQTTNGYYKLELSNSGYIGTLPTAVTATTYSNCKINSFNLTVSKGPNTLTVTETPAKQDRSHSGIPSYYIVSNMGNVDSGQTSESITSVNDVGVDVGSSTNTFSVTGVYPIFTNGISISTDKEVVKTLGDLDNPVTKESDMKLALYSGSTPFAVSFAAQSKEPYRLFVETGVTISDAMVFDGLANDWVLDYTDKFVKKEEIITKKVQGVDIAYAIYECNNGDGANKVRFKLNQ